jgi:hypothetical protein
MDTAGLVPEHEVRRIYVPIKNPACSYTLRATVVQRVSKVYLQGSEKKSLETCSWSRFGGNTGIC